jgi:hypothetical protein
MSFYSPLQQAAMDLRKRSPSSMTHVGLPTCTTEVCRNFREIHFGALTVYQSYNTVVGFSLGDVLAVQQNVWGTTTGKHLNEISRDHKIRVSEERFNQMWKEIAEPFLFGSDEAPVKVRKASGRQNKSIIV